MDAIILNQVKTHNLKNFDLILPHRKIYVLTGVSGSGKSSLALDTLYAEGQRRFVESLSSYARQFLERMERPDVESVSGIPPAIAIQAKNVITNARSTVGTQTEINDYLRLLFARVGVTYCPDCGVEVKLVQPHDIAEHYLNHENEEKIIVSFSVPLAKKGNKYLKEFLPELERQGFTEFLLKGKVVLAEELLSAKYSSPSLSVCVDRLKVSSKSKKRLIESLEMAFKYGKGKASVWVKEKEVPYQEGYSCYECGKNFREPTPNMFSFNSPLGACPTCQGFGRVITIDWNLVIPNPNKSIEEGVIEPWTKPSAAWEKKHLLKFCKKKKISLTTPWNKLPKKHRDWILKGTNDEDYYGVEDFFKYLEKKTYKMHVRIMLARYRGYVPCSECAGTRLKPEGLWVKIKGFNIFELQNLSLEMLGDFLEKLKLTKSQKERTEPVYLEIKRRVRFLNEVGLQYLSLSRLSRTLSGGEVQRIHLATSLGAALVDTLYVLDEPSVGLHERDNQLLIRLLKELRDLGNTIVVVEHDKTMIEAADEVIDLGPEGGERGGKVVFQGTVKGLEKAKNSLTGEYLSGRRVVERNHSDQSKSKEVWIKIKEAEEHNLKKIDVDIPLKKFVVMTGVSGSGKSTLLYDVLYHHYLRYKGRPVQDLGKVRSVSGFEKIDEVVLMDQSPIGRTPRSNPATYLKAYDEIRKIFSRTSEAKRHGFEAGNFSFNVDGGRCPECKGDGRLKVEMHFLADIFVPCEACSGKRFKKEILNIYYEGKNIDDILGMTIDDAIEFFAGEKKLIQKLEPLQKVGLGYLRLGQSATTFSGGEAQRLKIASEMSQKKAEHILYLFDEPTTGLHYHDIFHLMKAFEELLERGHSLVVIEHHMELIKVADYVIDLGLEGGEKGGDLLYQGGLKGLLKHPKSHTAKHLREIFRRNKPRETSKL